MISPSLLLIVVVAITAGAVIASTMTRNARSARIKALAAAWGMAYTADDRFQLTPRIAALFPTPGVADVVIRDLVFARDKAGRTFRYLFTVEYTTGVLRGKHRRIGVALLVESPTQPAAPIVLAPAGLLLGDQYAHLLALATTASPPDLPGAPAPP
jgi:hypothetical protein